MSGIVFQQIGLGLSLALGLCNYVHISIFTNQSEQLHFDQSGLCFLDPSNCKDFKFFIYMRVDQFVTRCRGDLYLYKSAPLWLGELYFPFLLNVVFFWLELNHRGHGPLSRAE